MPQWNYFMEALSVGIILKINKILSTWVARVWQTVLLHLAWQIFSVCLDQLEGLNVAVLLCKLGVSVRQLVMLWLIEKVEQRLLDLTFFFFFFLWQAVSSPQKPPELWFLPNWKDEWFPRVVSVAFKSPKDSQSGVWHHYNDALFNQHPRPLNYVKVLQSCTFKKLEPLNFSFSLYNLHVILVSTVHFQEIYSKASILNESFRLKV